MANSTLRPFISEKVPDDHPALFDRDTLGVAAFCVVRTQNGVRMAFAPAMSVLRGMLKTAFGGAVRPRWFAAMSASSTYRPRFMLPQRRPALLSTYWRVPCALVLADFAPQPVLTLEVA